MANINVANEINRLRRHHNFFLEKKPYFLVNNALYPRVFMN